MKVYRIKRIFWQMGDYSPYSILEAKAKWNILKNAYGDFEVESKNGIKKFLKKNIEPYLNMIYEPGVYKIVVSKIYEIEEVGENKFNSIWENSF